MAQANLNQAIEISHEFNGLTVQPIVEQCQGCERARTNEQGTYCLNFPNPAIKWRRGNCNMATHTKNGAQQNAAKVRIGQQKQKKR